MTSRWVNWVTPSRKLGRSREVAKFSMQFPLELDKCEKIAQSSRCNDIIEFSPLVFEDIFTVFSSLLLIFYERKFSFFITTILEFFSPNFHGTNHLQLSHWCRICKRRPVSCYIKSEIGCRKSLVDFEKFRQTVRQNFFHPTCDMIASNDVSDARKEKIICNEFSRSLLRKKRKSSMSWDVFSREKKKTWS